MGIVVKSQELEINQSNKLVEEFNQSKDFDLLLEVIKNHHQDIQVEDTDIFQLIFGGNNDEEGLKVDAIFVKLSEEVIIQALKEDHQNELRVKAHFSAINEDGKKVIRKAILQDDEVVVEGEIEFNASYFLFVEELKNPQGADEVINNGEIHPEAWYEGCLVFFNSGNGRYYRYNYCGAKCSGNGYTQSPINRLDTCCRSHDRCWKNFGHGDDGCDWQFYKCANETYDPGWWMVAEFGLLCSEGKLGSIC